MSNKTDIEEDIRICNIFIKSIRTDLEEEAEDNFETARAIENVLADRKKLQEHCKTLIKEKQELTSIALEDKADKYDSLVEKIKDKR